VQFAGERLVLLGRGDGFCEAVRGGGVVGREGGAQEGGRRREAVDAEVWGGESECLGDVLGRLVLVLVGARLGGGLGGWEKEVWREGKGREGKVREREGRGLTTS
jgi:hypothetical protein